MVSLEQLLASSKELPSLPQIYLKVSKLLASESSTGFQIGEALETDPSLTSKILKMLNSAYYGLPSKVSSVTQAVTLLGRTQLKQILLSSVLVGLFTSKNAKFSLNEFWHHSIKTAIIARQLALQNASVIDHEAFFTAGLLHDIGRLVIANEFPEKLEAIDVLVHKKGMNVMSAENAVLGFTHVDVSVGIMKKWCLPSMLIECATHHHETNHEGQFSIPTSIVYLANQFGHEPLSKSEDEFLKKLEQTPNWQQTECTQEQILVACRLAREQAREVMVLLGLIRKT